MEYWSNRPVACVLLVLAIGMLSFFLRFRPVKMIEEGENLSPKSFRWIRLIGMLAGVILFLANFGAFGGFLIQVLFGIFRSVDKLLGTILFFFAVGAAWYWAGNAGILLRRRATAERIDAFLDEDPVIAKLMKDVENGAKTVLLFKTRLEGIRSFTFDVDGYNHAAFSAVGCKEIAHYINRKTKDAYHIQICNGYAGEGSGSMLNKTQTGPRYRFSHVRMERK